VDVLQQSVFCHVLSSGLLESGQFTDGFTDCSEQVRIGLVPQTGRILPRHATDFLEFAVVQHEQTIAGEGLPTFISPNRILSANNPRFTERQVNAEDVPIGKQTRGCSITSERFIGVSACCILGVFVVVTRFSSHLLLTVRVHFAYSQTTKGASQCKRGHARTLLFSSHDFLPRKLVDCFGVRFPHRDG
jgi:hypothetical protein